MMHSLTNNLKPLDKNRAKIFLVGAGPGSADLLTLKAFKVINDCDVILIDNLVSQEIRNLIPKSVKQIYVGKIKDNHSVPQHKINEIMAHFYHQGFRLCRLKGGDPFVFGRGSEEMLALHNKGIEVELVPGITAASGCSGYSGIPLTHRGVSQGCTFITGHAEKKLTTDWSALAKLNHTLV